MVIKSDVAEEVARLKEQPGRDILVVGSSGLAQTLMQHDLVDEYRLWLHPVVLGRGKRLFSEGAPTTTLRLVDTKTTSSGLVILTYEPDRNDPKMTASIPPRAGRRRRVATDTESSRTVSNDLLVHALTDRADAQRRIGNEVDKFKGANHYGIAY